MKLIDYDNILEKVKKRNRVARFIVLLIGCFIVAITYNAFIVPEHIVYGGVGGVAIIVNKLTGIDTTLFINVVTFGLALISVILIGLKKTSYTIIGFLFYTIMVNITEPLAPLFQFAFDSRLFSILFYCFIDGIGFGLIYKAGFNTGGIDSVVVITQKFFKLPTAAISNIANGIIIICGAITFGLVNSIYAIIYLKIMNFISDRVVLGVSSSKLIFIKTHKLSTVEELLSKDLELGYTLIESTNGIGFLKKNIIMCVIPTDRYYDLKRELLSIDKKVEIFSNDCYTVVGGYTNSLINVQN